MALELLNLGAKQKWVILANLCYLCLLMTILNYNIIPVSVSLRKAYKLDPGKLSYVYSAGSLGLISSYVPLSTIMLKLGIKWGLIIGHIICLLGLFMETFIEQSGWFLVGGYALCRFGALSSTLAYGEAVSLWFSADMRTNVLLVIQASLYSGYALGHDILGYFINNESDLEESEIKTGVQGFLNCMLICVGVGIVSLFLTFQSKPEDAAKALTEPVSRNASIVEKEEEAIMKAEEEAEKINPRNEVTATLHEKDKQGFMHQFCQLITDPVYMVILFGVMLGNNTIGGHGVAMAVMLNSFGIPESKTLGLANSGTIGALLGILLYTLVKRKNKYPVTHLIWIAFGFEVTMFLFWYSFSYPYEYIWVTKFLYSIFNGPLGAIAIGLSIKYFKLTNPSLVLLGSATINIMKYTLNALAGSLVGWIMNEDSQFNSIIVEILIQYMIAISFFASVSLHFMLKKRGIVIKEP